MTEGNRYNKINDAKNHQSTGYGFRISTLYKTNNWAIGPYFTYWNIDESDTTDVSATHYDYWGRANTDHLSVYEPKNSTQEFGIKVSYQF